MSNNRGLAEQLPSDSPTSTPTAPLARPKVMRRPAQFTSPRPQQVAPTVVGPLADSTENENLAANSANAPAETSTQQKSWQDDARFGVAMLTIVVLVNLALMAWLPQMRPTALPMPEIRMGGSGTVATHPPAAAPLTFYTRPSATPHLQQETPSYPLPPLVPRSGADSGPNQ